LLVGGQTALAQTADAAPRVGDRLGAAAGESSEFAGGSAAGILWAAAAVAFVVYGVSKDDDSDSD